MKRRARRYKLKQYICGECGAEGVRLWREYNTFLDHQTLRCVWCAMRSQKVLTYDPERQNGCLGGLVAARPDGDGSFWGQTSGPQESVDAWFALPVFLP